MIIVGDSPISKQLASYEHVRKLVRHAIGAAPANISVTVCETFDTYTNTKLAQEVDVIYISAMKRATQLDPLNCITIISTCFVAARRRASAFSATTVQKPGESVHEYEGRSIVEAYTALLARLNTNKTLHIGEVGWPSSVTEFNQTELLTGTYSDYTTPVFKNKYTQAANLKEQSKYAAAFMLSIYRYHEANKAANLYITWGLREAYDTLSSDQLNVNGTAVYGLFTENRRRRDIVHQIVKWTPP
eukprot:13395-Heterococcus_DN1.PRE.1